MELINMLILSNLVLLLNSLVSFYGINVNGNTYVVDNNSQIDSQCYEVGYRTSRLSESLGHTYGTRLLTSNPSTDDYLYRQYFTDMSESFCINGFYNSTNFSDTGNPYYNFTYYWKDYFQISLDMSYVRQDLYYLKIYQYNQCNVYFNIYTNIGVTNSGGYGEETYRSFIHYSLLKPVVNNFNYTVFTIPSIYSQYGNYARTIIEFGLEDDSITAVMNTSGDSFQTGYDSGYSVGYDDGYSNGNNSGYTTGYNQGSSDGYNSGYSTGYSEGITQQNTQFINLFGAVADTPVIMFYRLFNFDLFGTSVIVIILSLFTALVLLGILRRFLKF